MSATFADVRSQQDSIRIPTVWVAAAVSIVLHALLLLTMPELKLDSVLGMENKDDPKQGSIAVRLAAPPPTPPRVAHSPPPAPAPTHAPQLAKPAPAAHAAPAPPPVLTQTKPSPVPAPAVTPPAPKPAAAPAPQAGGDFAAFVEQRRRARGAEAEPPPPPQQPADTEQERHSREVARNLGLNRGTGLGADRNRGGGVFQIISINDRNATVAFYGWNKTIERKVLQTIEVNRGDAPTIELAVVRRMIELIRTQASGDITWESIRLKRDIELSARPADTRKLEAFLLEEFFAVTQK